MKPGKLRDQGHRKEKKVINKAQKTDSIDQFCLKRISANKNNPHQNSGERVDLQKNSGHKTVSVSQFILNPKSVSALLETMMEANKTSIFSTKDANKKSALLRNEIQYQKMCMLSSRDQSFIKNQKLFSTSETPQTKNQIRNSVDGCFDLSEMFQNRQISGKLIDQNGYLKRRQRQQKASLLNVEYQEPKRGSVHISKKKLHGKQLSSVLAQAHATPQKTVKSPTFRTGKSIFYCIQKNLEESEKIFFPKQNQLTKVDSSVFKSENKLFNKENKFRFSKQNQSGRERHQRNSEKIRPIKNKKSSFFYFNSPFD